jgi:hypothetical protein
MTLEKKLDAHGDGGLEWEYGVAKCRLRSAHGNPVPRKTSGGDARSSSAETRSRSVGQHVIMVPRSRAGAGTAAPYVVSSSGRFSLGALL